MIGRDLVANTFIDIIFVFSVISKDDRNCNIEIDKFINLQPKETLTFNLSRSNLTETYDLHKCQMKVKLQLNVNAVYYYFKRYNIKLQVSMVTFNSCLYNIDIYIGDSSRNEPITVSIIQYLVPFYLVYINILYWHPVGEIYCMAVTLYSILYSMWLHDEFFVNELKLLSSIAVKLHVRNKHILTSTCIYA